QWVRQSAKRRSAPNVLTIEEVRHLLAALPPRERILVFLDVSTGLRQSELFGLQWQDIDFEIGELRVTRSVVGHVVGTCKTEASQKAIPLHEDLIEALKGWRQQNPYKEAQHWVFASPSSGGKNPYWGQQLMRRDIRPVAEKLGITKRIGWHTFRHTYSTLLRSEEHTSELQSRGHLVCRLLLEKKKRRRRPPRPLRYPFGPAVGPGRRHGQLRVH